MASRTMTLVLQIAIGILPDAAFHCDREADAAEAQSVRDAKDIPRFHSQPHLSGSTTAPRNEG